MKTYDLIIIGTGSAMNTVGPFLERNPGAKIAVIDKDPPGGICLTKGCIPTKLLVYPAELIRLLGEAADLGVHVKIEKIDFQSIMSRMRSLVQPEIESIRKALSKSKEIDYYPEPAEFTGPYIVKVGRTSIRSPMIFLGLGSRPRIPTIENLDSVEYHTSDSILQIEHLPGSMVIVGGGYIAAEYGHFFSAMGVEVKIVGRNSRFLPEEEPEISALAQKEMSRHLSILTDHEVLAVENVPGKKRILVLDRLSGKRISIQTDAILLAAGRESNSDLLHPEKSGVRIDPDGWVIVNEYLETTQRNIWSLGDAVGLHQFKHVANYESQILYYNAVLNQKIPVDYHAVPHAVFTYPEIAAVGLKEREAVERYGDRVLIGFKRYGDTAKGEAMGARDDFVKVIVEDGTAKILGAHIIGPHASLLIQELITLMYTRDQTIDPVIEAMHIHPALSEVVANAVQDLMPVDQYHEKLILSTI